MQDYHVKLISDASKSFRCQKAADSLDIDVNKKLIHELKIQANITNEFTIGLILGASGSGKTTLAKKIFGENCFENKIDNEKQIIDQFNKNYSYDDCANFLTGIGLTSVPCWIRPVKTLSNGQRARAEAALAMSETNQVIIIDEWTSVVDRTVAKVMSHCVQKHARKQNKKIILLSCHYDVLEWLNPDWVIDCNEQKFHDRRLLSSSERSRKEQLKFEIREIDKSSWRYFSKYHYLSEKLPGGKIFLFGLFEGNNQIGFQCFANYVPTRKNTVPIYHFNRTVIHPDYAGMGLGIKLIDQTTEIMIKKYKFKIMGKFSSTPIFKAMIKNKKWKLCEIKKQIGKMPVGRGIRKKGYRENIKTYSFEYVGNSFKNS